MKNITALLSLTIAVSMAPTVTFASTDPVVCLASMAKENVSESISGVDFPAAKQDVLTNNNRPAPGDRLFHSDAVERQIASIVGQLTNKRLAWMFVNCYPNTIDTTVHYEEDVQGNPDTFVYTGDIHAMWLRDSGAQVYPYVQLANQGKHSINYTL